MSSIRPRIGICLLVASCTVSDTAPNASPAAEAPLRTATAPGESDPLKEIQAHIFLEQHTARRGEHGLEMIRPDANARVQFDASGAATLVSLDTEWAADSASLQTVRLNGEPLSAAAPQLTECADDPCLQGVEIDHGPVSSWWTNEEDGLRQGWTVHTPSSRIQLDIAVSADVTVAKESLRIGNAATGWRGDQIAAWDANNVPIDIELIDTDDGFAVIADTQHAAFPVTIDPVWGAAAWSQSIPGVRLGYAQTATFAGDVNDDGFPDLVVGAYHFSTATNRVGRVWLFLGTATGLSATASQTWTGTGSSHSLGRSIDAIGDFNDDGYDDVIVGASGQRRAYVLRGNATGLDTLATALQITSGAIYFGTSVAGIGDVNDDGYDDVAVGGHGAASLTGQVRVVLGAATGLGTVTVLPGQVSGESFGRNVAPAGDFNNDGYDDLLVTASHSPGPSGDVGKVYVFAGSATGITTMVQQTFVGTVTSYGANGYGGYGARSLGDINDDGFDDIGIVPRVGQGEALHIHYGSATWGSLTPDVTVEVAGNPSFTNNFASGDVDHDGYTDLAIGDFGTVHIYPGTENGFDSDPMISTSGYITAIGRLLLGDANGDDYADLFAEIGGGSKARVWHGYDINRRPNVEALPDLELDEGESFTVDAVATDPEGDPLTYLWNFGSATADTQQATHTYTADRNATVSLVVTDSEGNNRRVTFQVVVLNVPPTIDSATAPAGVEGQDVEFVLQTSDPGADDTNLQVFIDYGDGQTGSSLTHTYADNGTYTVDIQVTDSDGASDAVSLDVNVANVAPVLTALTPATHTEGDAIQITAQATDVPADTITYGFDWGDGTVTSGQVGEHTYPDNGEFTVTVTATDDDGGTSSTSTTLTVQNADPTVVSLAAAAGFEGVPVAFTSEGADAGADTLTYAWRFPNGDTLAGANVSYTFGDDGTYQATLIITDDDGGSVQQDLSVDVANVDPVVLTTDWPTPSEGLEATLAATFSDVPDDTLTATWDLGDGTISTGETITHTWADSGTYQVELTVTDEDGGEATVSQTVSVENLDPVIESIDLPAVSNEGELLTVTASVFDVAADPLTYAWDFGDTATGAGIPIDHTWGDNGTYTVNLQVQDDDGGSANQSVSIEILNVAPTFTNQAPTSGKEGDLYTWAIEVDEPGDDELTFTLVSAPAGVTLNGQTLEWTPTGQQALDTFHDLELKVEDDDGGEDMATWTVELDFIDDDNDGMSDFWENQNGLDASDPTDGTGDPDADGRSNGLEFEQRTNPGVFEGPGTPILLSPADGDEVDTLTASLTWENAAHPLDIAETYQVEVYEDEDLTVLLATGSDIAALEWVVDPALTEDTWVYWVVQAQDIYTQSAWSEPFSMRVNAEESPPTIPVLAYPIQDEIAASDPLTLQWLPSTDVDEDAVEYDVELLQEGVVIESDTLPDEALALVSWVPSTLLIEDNVYSWRARAVDEHGVASEWSFEESFLFSLEDSPPVGLAILSPGADEFGVPQSPEFRIQEAIDPENSGVHYELELDGTADFDAATVYTFGFASTASAEMVFATEPEGVLLDDRTDYHVRVRALDDGDIASPWEVVSFRVGALDLPPEVPELLSPEDGFSVRKDEELLLEASTPIDPDGDEVTLEYRVATDMDFANIVEEGTGETHTLVVPNVSAELYWSARAVDSTGKASDWAEPFGLAVYGPGVPGAGCGCSGSGASGAWLGLVVLGLVRRRRSMR